MEEEHTPWRLTVQTASYYVYYRQTEMHPWYIVLISLGLIQYWCKKHIMTKYWLDIAFSCIRYKVSEICPNESVLNHDLPYPDSKVHGANMGPTWDLWAAGGPHVDHMILAIWVGLETSENGLWQWKKTLHLCRLLPVASVTKEKMYSDAGIALNLFSGLHSNRKSSSREI